MATEKPVLHYFRNRGLAELVRLMLAAAEVEWEDAPYIATPEQVASYRSKGLLFFDQFPLLQIDGHNIVQSMAIVRYLANKYNINANDNDQTWRMDVISEGILDFKTLLAGYKFMPDDEFYRLGNKAADRYVPILEKTLKENGGQFLIGDRLTMVDICLLDVLIRAKERFPKQYNAQPTLMAFHNRMCAQPNFARYFSGPQCFGQNMDEMTDVVKYALGMPSKY